MALIPKVEPKQEKKVVSARLDEEAHTMLQRYAAFLGGATHEYIIGESLKRLFRRDKEFNEWLEKTTQARLQLLKLLNPHARLPRTQQGQRQRQNDPTHSQFERLSRPFAGDAHRHSAVFQDALACHRCARLEYTERVFPSASRLQRPLDLCGPEGFLSSDAVHHTLHRLFVPAVGSVYLHAETQTAGQATVFAFRTRCLNPERD